MTAPLPIAQGEDFYVPAFALRLRGRPAGKDVVHDVVQVTYKDDIDKIDSVDLVVNNWDADRRTFNYGNDPTFDPGSQLQLSLGYGQRERLPVMINGEITGLKPTFPAAGQPTITVTALNVLHRLRRQQETRVYENLTDTQIAVQIAQRLGLDLPQGAAAQAATEPRHPYLLQDNTYDILFLLQRARRAGYDLFVTEDGRPKLHFGPSTRLRRATYRLDYGSSLISFTPTLSTANQVGKVVMRSWDRIRKQVNSIEVTRAQLDSKGVGRGGRQAVVEQSFDQRVEILNRPVRTVEEARQIAKGVFERIAKGLVTASGQTIGLPELRAGSVIQIGGLDPRFDGRYFVSATTHTVGAGGYTTSFECRQEELA
jgi:uncharacterized protein